MDVTTSTINPTTTEHKILPSYILKLSVKKNKTKRKGGGMNWLVISKKPLKTENTCPTVKITDGERKW